MSKLYFLAGLGVGYILGAKAGKEQYRKIADAAKTTWEKPGVQRVAQRVDAFVDKKAPLLHSVAETIAEPTEQSDGADSGSSGSPTAGVTADGTPFSVGSDNSDGAKDHGSR